MNKKLANSRLYPVYISNLNFKTQFIISRRLGWVTRKWVKEIAVKEHFINSGVIEMTWDWRDVRGRGKRMRSRRGCFRDMDTRGLDRNRHDSRREEVVRLAEYQPQLVWECSCRSVCAFSNCLSACLPDIIFHIVWLMSYCLKMDQLILPRRNFNFYDCTKDLRTGHYFGE